MPFIARPGTSPPELVRVLLAELPAPFTDGFVGNNHTTGEKQFLAITVAEGKTEVQPDGVADNLAREPVVFVEIGRG